MVELCTRFFKEWDFCFPLIGRLLCCILRSKFPKGAFPWAGEQFREGMVWFFLLRRVRGWAV